MENCSGIYRIRNTLNNLCYIGSAKNLRIRIRRHKQQLRDLKHKNLHLQSSWNLYGEDVFIFEIIEFCEPDSLILCEQKHIDAHKCYEKEFGYNICPTAYSALGRVTSQETKAKISAIHKGVPRPYVSEVMKRPEIIAKAKARLEKLRARHLGDPKSKKIWADSIRAAYSSDEAREMQAAKVRGIKRSQSTMEKYRIAWAAREEKMRASGFKKRPEHVAKLLENAAIARKNPEMQARRAASIRAAYADPELRERQRQKSLGRKRSPETKERCRLAAVAREAKKRAANSALGAMLGGAGGQ